MTSAGKNSLSETGRFEVISVTPQGELSSSVRYPSIQIQFSEPVVPLQKLGEPSDTSDIVTITPAIKGVFRWYGTSLLSFESSERAVPQKEYSIQVSDKVTSVADRKISGNLSYSFYPEELKIVSVLPGYEDVKKGIFIDEENVAPSAAKDILVTFNFPVVANVVSEYIKVDWNGSDAHEFTAVQEKENALRLTLKENPSEDAQVTVQLAAGAMADKDCYKTTEVTSASFHTLHPLEIEYFDEEPYTSSEYTNPIAFRFNILLDQNGAKEIASNITTDLNYKITEKNVAVDGRQVIVHDLPVNFGSTYKITLGANIKDAYGRKLGSDNTYSVEVPEARSFAHFKDYGFGILEAQFAPKLVFEHQNIKNGSSYTVKAIADSQGKKVSEKENTVVLNPNEIPQNVSVLEGIDLVPYLDSKNGEYHGAVQFDAKMTYEYKTTDWKTEKKVIRSSEITNNQTVQVTDLGVTARYGYNKAVVLVTSLKTGKPVKGALVTAYLVKRDSRAENFNIDVITGRHRAIGIAKTDDSGFGIIELEKNAVYSKESGEDVYIEVKTSDDRVIYRPASHDLWRSDVYDTKSPSQAQEVEMVTFIFTDRGLYKPGETVTFRGIDRNLTIGEYEAFKGKYEIQLTDGSWSSKIYYTENGTTTDNGTFWGRFTLPEDLDPGTYSIVYKRSVPGKSSKQSQVCEIQVQYFERLRFEVSTSVPSITYYSGDDVSADINASYLGGGSLAGSSYDVYWNRRKAYFSIDDASYKDFSFGPVQGYDWGDSLDSDQGVLNDDGRGSTTQHTGGEKLLGTPYLYTMQASVVDSGNQSISSSVSTLVHPAKYYIGIKRNKVDGFPKKGDTILFDYVCVTPDGSSPLSSDLPSDKKMTVELLREEWKQLQQVSYSGQIYTRYEQEMVSERKEDVSLSGTNAVSQFSVVPEKGGSYVLRVSSKDSRGRDVITEKRFYVTSSDWYWNNRNSDTEITMTPDKENYEVGDVAHILMQSPLPKGDYLMTVEREGIISQEIRHISSPCSVIDVPVKENFVPVMYVTLSSYSVRNGMPKNSYNTPDLDKPKGLFGVATLKVNPTLRSFSIDIKTDKPSYKPGETAYIQLHASKNGKPLSNAEITLMAVDRGVIDLINYHVPDPVSYFYSKYRFPNCIAGGDSRAYLMDPVTYEIKNLIGGDDGDGDKMQERKNFDPTAVFVPDLVTDSDGNAAYEFKLPDSLTAYRITAVGVCKNDFALSEDQMDVANPVSVRTALPRKLRLNDAGEVGVVISNIDGVAHDVNVTLNVYDGIDKISGETDEGDIQKLPGSASVSGNNAQNISVASDKTQSLMFSIKALKSGWITLEYIVKSDVVNEKILMPLEIEKPYLYETVTTVGDVTGEEEKGSASVEEKLVIPGGAEDGKGELYVQLDPTRLGVLREAIRYVFHYPYGCLEQKSAAVLPLVAFDKYIKLFGLESEVKKPKSVAAKTIKEFGKSQRYDGGFPYWPGGYSTSPFVSMRIAEIVALAKENGVSVKSIDIDRLSDYLVEYANKFVMDDGDIYSMYQAAHAYYAASCLGADISMKNVQKIIDNNSSDSETLALCGLICLNCDKEAKAKEVASKLRKYITLTSRGASFTNGWKSGCGYWSFFNDSSEVYALALQLFTQLDPKDDLNQHLVYELLMLQKSSHGYWSSTAATARVLIALRTYIQSNNMDDLNFTAEVLLNKKKLAEGKFKGVAAQPVDATIDFKEDPVKSMPRDKELPLVFTKNGRGSLYYTASMKYAIPVTEQTARDEGLCIFTEITDVKTGEVVSGNELVSGKVYKEKVFISSTRNREYVAVRAPVPAGCEIMNAAFVTTGTFPNIESDSEQEETEEYYEYDEYDSYSEDYNWGLSYQGIYDSEVQYFWDYFPMGFQKVEFMFRASRCGDYNTPSATAECMYQEEIFGRSNGKIWTVKQN
ncbi:MAG: alpha-2-macroglobulin [Treponema sp.]|nr:alpha-2-macroglobulin [Treponema sp.]